VIAIRQLRDEFGHNGWAPIIRLGNRGLNLLELLAADTAPLAIVVACIMGVAFGELLDLGCGFF
jgi:hypothetical protein